MGEADVMTRIITLGLERHEWIQHADRPLKGKEKTGLVA